jgi:uncharacterized protein YcfL
MNIKPILTATALAGLVALNMAASPAVAQQTIASKLELQGVPESVSFTGLMMREQNGLLRVQAELTNSDNKQQSAFYRIKWLDETGFQVWDDEPWKPVLLHGEQKLTLQIIAPTTKARDFRIQLSAAQNKSNTNGQINFDSNR